MSFNVVRGGGVYDSLPLHCPHGRVAWQNHYSLCKHTLTSQLELVLPHTNTRTRTHTHAYELYTHILLEFTTRTQLGGVSGCRWSLPAAVAEPYELIVLIAYFLMFVYRVATCRSGINHIYCPCLLIFVQSDICAHTHIEVTMFSLAHYFPFNFL